MMTVKTSLYGKYYAHEYARDVCRKSYLDRADYDASNRVFYIYYLGAFSNKAIYTYGETYDTHATELRLKKTIPFYKQVYNVVCEDVVNGKEKFERYICSRKLKCKIPLDIRDIDDWDAFLLNDQFEFNTDILCALNDVYDVSNAQR
jgi:hypothetical protein